MDASTRRKTIALILPVAFAAAATAHAGTGTQQAPSATAVIAVANCDGAGPGSLRDAVAAAASGDTIDMRSLECRRLVLTGGAIVVPQDDLTIRGPTRAFLIDADRAGRVFEHSGAGTLRLRAMSIGYGYVAGPAATGGCIDSSGDLRLEYVRVHDCFVFESEGMPGSGGGAIAANDVSLYHSEVFANIAWPAVVDEYPVGGGILAWGHLALVRSIVRHNEAKYGHGGGFHAGGGLHARYSEVSGNHAQYFGAFYAEGGDMTVAHSLIADNDTAISFNAGLGAADGIHPVVVVNTTVADNMAGLQSGLLLQGADNDKSIVSSSIAFNDETRTGPRCQGAIEFAGTLHLENTMVAKNWCQGRRVGVTGDPATAQVVGSHNLVMAATVPLPADTITTNPYISPLADNGGRTRTLGVWLGSPALDAGNNNAGLAYDQRGPGFPRVKGTRADIGAFER